MLCVVEARDRDPVVVEGAGRAIGRAPRDRAACTRAARREAVRRRGACTRARTRACSCSAGNGSAAPSHASAASSGLERADLRREVHEQPVRRSRPSSSRRSCVGGSRAGRRRHVHRGRVVPSDRVHEHVAVPLQEAAGRRRVRVQLRNLVRGIPRIEQQLRQLLRQAFAQPCVRAVDVAELERAPEADVLAVAEAGVVVAWAAAGRGREAASGEDREGGDEDPAEPHRDIVPADFRGRSHAILGVMGRGLALVVLALLCGAGCGGTRAADPFVKLHRPLHIGKLSPRARCPVSAVSRRLDFARYGVHPGLGRGPGVSHLELDARRRVPAAGDDRVRHRRLGRPARPLVRRARVRGPVLIRGRRLDGSDPVRFEHGDNPPAAELRIGEEDLGRWPVGTTTADGQRYRRSYTRLRAPGCYAYQVDGPSVQLPDRVPGRALN